MKRNLSSLSLLFVAAACCAAQSDFKRFAGAGIYELGTGKPVRSEHPVVLRLVENGSVKNEVRLPMSAASADQSVIEDGPRMRVGDPLHPSNTAVYASGEESSFVSTAFRQVSLPGQKAILVQQQGGFEHVKREHRLYAALKGKLALVWSASEGAGPTWSSADIIDVNSDGTDEIIFYQGFAHPTAAETLTVTAFSWNAAQGRFLKTVTPRMYSVQAGIYPTLAKARQAREAAGECGANLWILRDPARGYSLAARTVRKQAAEEGVKSVRECFPSASIR